MLASPLLLLALAAPHSHRAKPTTLKVGEGCRAVALSFDANETPKAQVQDALRLLGYYDWFRGAEAEVAMDCEDTAGCRDLGDSTATAVKAANAKLAQLKLPPELVPVAERRKRDWRFALWMGGTLARFCANWSGDELKAGFEDLGSGLCGKERDKVDDAKGPQEKCHAAAAWQLCARELFQKSLPTEHTDDLHGVPFQAFLMKHHVALKSLAKPGQCP